MPPQSESDYKKIFTELIKKQIVVLGPDITLAKVKNVQGIEVNDQGEVTNIDGDPQAILQLLINQFVELSGTIVKKTTESILSAYPGVAKITPQPVMPQVSTPQQQVAPVNQPQNDNGNASSVGGANPFSGPVSQSNQTSGQSSSKADENSSTVNNASNDPNMNINTQFPKKEMEDINKALSELESQGPSSNQNPQTHSQVENKSKDVQQSNN